MSSTKTSLFALCAAAASGWAAYLVHLHNAAIAHTLEPGALCSDGSCSAVLASEWSTILGVPVSAPAVPLFGALALLALLWQDRRDRLESLAHTAVFVGLVGLGLGAFLVYQMIFVIDAICRYCLVMDGLTALTLVTGAMVHPDGPAAAFTFRAPRMDGLQRAVGALAGAIVLGTPVVLLALPEPAEEAGAPVQIVLEEAPSTAAPAAAAAPAQEPAAPPAAQTRRLVIPAEVHEIPIGPDVPVKGPAKAPVTIAVFEDFQCPFCSKLAGTLEELLSERPEQVRVAWFHFPMHKDCNQAGIAKSMHPFACAAARAGVCAHEQGKFWPMHDRMFHNNAHLADDDLLAYAKDVGLDQAAFKTCLASPKTQGKVLADADLGGEHKVRGTPAFFVNGRMLQGAQPIEALRAAVDAIAADPSDRVLLDVEVADEVIAPVTDAAPQITVNGPYGALQIDAFEASLSDGKAQSVPGATPARGVSWYEARDACQAAGKRLCTEAEWLTACSGALPVDANGDGLFSNDPLTGRVHPYGDYEQRTWCAASRKKDDPRPLITGEHPKCRTPEGVYDLEGGVKEWVGLTPDVAAVKGGSYYSIGSARCAYHKDTLAPAVQDDSTGFRCCSGPVPEQLSADHHPGGKVGDKVQDWSLRDLDGRPLGTAELAGHPTIITFWASWCGPCRKELPALGEVARQYEAQGLRVVGINVDREPAKAKAFLRQMPLPFPVVLDSDSALMNRFDTRGVPTTFWIQRDGTIRQRTVGYDERGRPELEANVRALLE